MNPAPSRLRVAFAGSGAFGLPTLSAVAENHDVVAIFTQPDKPAGRGKRLTPTPVALAADGLGVAAVKTHDFNAEKTVAADVLLVVAFGQKIAREKADAPRLGAINLHASRLPRWRGAAPVHHAILAGDAFTGNSVIRLADRMDAGKVLGMTRRPVRDDQTAGELHDLLADDGAPLVLRVLDELSRGVAAGIDQEESLATRAPKLSRSDAIFDPEIDARSVARRVNGLSPWPGVRVDLPAGPATLLRAIPAGNHCDAPPGTLLDGGTIACGGSVLKILEIRPDGGTKLSAEAYARGYPWTPGFGVKTASS